MMQSAEEFTSAYICVSVEEAGDMDLTERIRARDAEWQARVEKLEAALRYLHDSGPTPEGFRNLDKDCYEYAIDMLNPGEDGLPDKDPRWFDGWLRMIEESASRSEEEEKQ